MNKVFCEKCKSYYNKNGGGFHNGDYTICEKCGRLLVSRKRAVALRPVERKTPLVLMIGEDSTDMWKLRRAIYDPRTYISDTEVSEIVFGSTGASSVYNKSGEIAELVNLVNPDPEERNVFRWIVKEPPTLIVLLLDCTKTCNLSKYTDFMDNLQRVMYLTRSYYVPLVVVLCNADRMHPSDVKDPRKYSSDKKRAIREVVERYKRYFEKMDFEVEDIIPISTYVKWGYKSSADPSKAVSAEDIILVEDGRYNVDKLRRYIKASVIRLGYRL